MYFDVLAGLFLFKYINNDIAIFPNEKSHKKLKHASTLLEIGEAEKALEQIDLSMKIDVPKGVHFYMKGCILYSLEDFKGAIKNFETSLKLVDNFYSLEGLGTPIEMDMEVKADSYFMLGISKYYLEDFGKAIKYFDEGLNIIDNKKRSFIYRLKDILVGDDEILEVKNKFLFYRGASYYYLSLYENTIKDLNDLRNVELDIDKKKFLYEVLGDSKSNLKDYQGAIHDFNVALNLDYQNADILHKRGLARFCLEDYEEAIKDFDEVIVRDSSNKDALMYRDYSKSELEIKHKNSSNKYGLDKFDEEVPYEIEKQKLNTFNTKKNNELNSPNIEKQNTYSKKKFSILFIDDDINMRNLIGIHLENSGFEVQLSEDSYKGFSLAKEKLPDLIILDLMLPKIDGLTLCNMLRKDERTKNIQILMITALSNLGGYRFRGANLLFDDYISKPFNLQELDIQIKKFLMKKIK